MMAHRFNDYGPNNWQGTPWRCLNCDEREEHSYHRFPIQMDRSGPQITIPWEVAEAAYRVYHAKWPDQSLEKLAERGGFGRLELLWLLDGAPGHAQDIPGPKGRWVSDGQGRKTYL